MLGISYRNMEILLHTLKLPWQEAVPNHSTIPHAFKRMPEAYLTTILQQTTLQQTKKYLSQEHTFIQITVT
jgi:hypothetical protein